MCITFFLVNDSKDSSIPYKFILAFNRDEVIGRETLPLHAWSDDPNIIGGRDVHAGGTWIAVNVKTGNIALLTNVVWKGWKRKGKSLSRGKLTSNFLATDFYEKWLRTSKFELSKQDYSAIARDYCKKILEEKDKYNGFNLIVGNLKALCFWYCGNYCSKEMPIEISNGIHSLSNLDFTRKYEKEKLGASLFEELIKKVSQEKDEEMLFSGLAEIMQNQKKFDDFKSSIFVPWTRKFLFWVYGTTCTTYITLDKENHLTIREQTYEGSPDKSFCIKPKVFQLD